MADESKQASCYQCGATDVPLTDEGAESRCWPGCRKRVSDARPVGSEIVTWLHGLEQGVRNIVANRVPCGPEERAQMRERLGVYEGVANDVRRKWPALFAEVAQPRPAAPPPSTVTFPALPINEDDQRLVDRLVADSIPKGTRPLRASEAKTVERGDGWTMYLGDCIDVVEPADHVITDPPYGFGAYATDKDGGDVVERLRRYEASGVTAVFGYPETLVAWCVDLGWRPDEWITWWPTNAAAKAGGRHKGVPRQTEHIAIFGTTTGAADITAPRSFASCKTPQSVGLSPDVRLGDVWQDASPGIAFNSHLRLHPNEKPVDLLLKLVLLVSKPGETIADPFAGSGTTGVAALRLGRKFVGVEKDPAHFATCCARLRAEAEGSTLEAQRAGQISLLGGVK